MNSFTYSGAKTKEISFPLGGIGSGCIGLGGDGRLIDWEIRNRPNKGSLNGFSHFAIKAEAGGKTLDSRILHGDLKPPYIGTGSVGNSGHGFGPVRETLAGLPHFRDTVFEGRYPFATVKFNDSHFPGKVALTAFNPFIPLNEDDSSIPAAFFEFTITNTSKRSITYTIAGTLGNPFGKPVRNRIVHSKGMTALHIESTEEKDTVAYGDLTLATDAGSTSHQHSWYRGSWFDSLEVYWKDLTAPGRFVDRKYPNPNRNEQGALAAHFRLAPGQTTTVRYVISWNSPNCENYWNQKEAEHAKNAGIPLIWKNYYATLWKDSARSAAYSLKNWKRLCNETRLFQDALFSSSLPHSALDAVSANISILKSPTVLRLTDGTLYGFEGCRGDSGCCPGSCTHVWNYAQAHAFLFPGLARSMRDVDYKYNQQEDGGMPFRIMLPLGIKHPAPDLTNPNSGRFSCADGLFGSVMLVYREWKISGDTEWMKSLLPSVCKSVSYAWAPTNWHRWDPDKTGVLRGRQHHTLDMELYGPSSWLCGFYLGALKAAAEMAEAAGDLDLQADFLDLFAKGKNWMEENLFNGEYYHQLVDIKDRAVLKSFSAEEAYWSAEHREMKYQIDMGCAIDQTLAQYHATLYGLGEIFDPRRNRKAMESIFRHNFHANMREVYNPCRLYCLNDEGGAAICSWPDQVRKPAIPLTYAQETMHGFEYAAAVQMIACGMISEGMALVKAIRDRYDGEKRNPWNEIECGSHYARSMASYGLLNAFSGFEFDMPRGHIGFRPALPGKFRCFWSLGTAWGKVEIDRKATTLCVLGGRLKLQSLTLPLKGTGTVTVRTASRRIAADREGDTLRFSKPVTVASGASLSVTVA